MIDLLVKNLRLWGKETRCDLAIAEGRFVAWPNAETAVAKTIDAGGRMAIPGFVEPHIHLDKVLINEDVRPNKSGTLTEAIEIIWERKRAYTRSEVAARAGRVIELAILSGTKHLRTHVDVDTIGGLTPLEGVLAARQHY